MGYGAIKVEDIETIKKILIREGFYEPIFQTWKDGQVFGLVKPLNGLLEVHIRAYEDNTLDAEVELSRDYLEHLFNENKPYYGFLIEILETYRISYEIIKPIPPDPKFISVPEKLIKWKPLMALLAMIFVGIALIGKSKKQNNGTSV